MKSNITEEYATLSLLTGILMAFADQHLGGHRFSSRARQECWTLTEEKLARWKKEAIEAGVPPEQLKIPDDLIAKLPAVVRMGMKVQNIIDGVTEHA